MKHFIIEITYTVPVESLGDVLPRHREFLQTGYDSGMLLASGPQEPRTGGIIIARADSISTVKDFFAQDPYALEKAATHRFIEFDPVKFQPFIASWLRGE